MPKKEKKQEGINTGGAYVNGDIKIEGQGTFIGRDQKKGSKRKTKTEIIIPIVIAVITTAGVIVAAIINYNAEIDKVKLQTLTTQTPQLTLTTYPSFTPEVKETVTSYPIP